MYSYKMLLLKYFLKFNSSFLLIFLKSFVTFQLFKYKLMNIFSTQLFKSLKVSFKIIYINILKYNCFQYNIDIYLFLYQ